MQAHGALGGHTVRQKGLALALSSSISLHGADLLLDSFFKRVLSGSSSKSGLHTVSPRPTHGSSSSSSSSSASPASAYEAPPPPPRRALRPTPHHPHRRPRVPCPVRLARQARPCHAVPVRPAPASLLREAQRGPLPQRHRGRRGRRAWPGALGGPGPVPQPRGPERRRPGGVLPGRVAARRVVPWHLG